MENHPIAINLAFSDADFDKVEKLMPSDENDEVTKEKRVFNHRYQKI